MLPLSGGGLEVGVSWEGGVSGRVFRERGGVLVYSCGVMLVDGGGLWSPGVEGMEISCDIGAGGQCGG